jgi:hypothetical protein
MAEVFGLETGHYRRSNSFWHSHSIADLVANAAPAERMRMEKQTADIKAAYHGLSETYQSGKTDNDIPLN